MKKFAIAINSEKEYEKVRKYAEKWGYKRLANEVIINKGLFMVYDDCTFNDNNVNFCDGYHIIAFTDNWRKAIRKNSPLKLENICVRIDTVERVKEVWDIIKDCGVEVYEYTKIRLEKGRVREYSPYLAYENKFVGGGCDCPKAHNLTEITPKQLAQILGVKRGKSTVWELNINTKVNDNGDGIVFDVTPVKDEPIAFSGDYYSDPTVTVKAENIWEDMTITPKTGEQAVTEFLIHQISQVNKRIDKLAKNYKITESDSLVTKKELKEINSKLRKRMYDLEKHFNWHKKSLSEIDYIINSNNKNRKYKTINKEDIRTIPIPLQLPKIAIRVENEQEFNDLMKIYDVLGWKWINGNKPLNDTYKKRLDVDEKVYISFNNGFGQVLSSLLANYTIIPFSQIKNLK